MTILFNFEVIFSLYKVIFQDLITKKMIGEGFRLHGLYYFTFDSRILKGFQAISTPISKHLMASLSSPSFNVCL